ncbi:unnamed protein product [Mytilus edulis]|uniref:Uncharacterized protein n=1 Tax=Mytilus edulis TaxID=6550 RepID=A0A8S3TPU7_MYTED|nr:unnamed protein product [Mytilus edulis]
MPPKGIKRTNTSNSSDNNSSVATSDKKQTKKKSKKKSKTDSTNVNTGDNSNVNTSSHNLNSGHLQDNLNSFITMNSAQFSQDTHPMYSQNPGPMYQMQNQQICSTPNLNMTPHQHIKHMSPINQQLSMQQRPIWVDELFCKMDNFETKLNKLENIDSLVTNLNARVVKIEDTTKSYDNRIEQVERCTQLISNEFDTQKKKIVGIQN